MNKEINIDLKRCLNEIIRKWWLIILIGGVFFAMSYLISVNHLREDEYTAEATVFSTTDYSSLTLYSDIITSAKVSDKAATLLNNSNLDTNSIKKMITVKTYSLVLGIQATSTDEVLAIKVANAVAAVFLDEVNQITSSNGARLLDEATTAELTYNKQLEQWKFRIIVTLAGIGLLCAVIIARVIFSKKVHNISDIGLGGELDVIGIIPLFKKSRRSNG